MRRLTEEERRARAQEMYKLTLGQKLGLAFLCVSCVSGVFIMIIQLVETYLAQ